MPRKLLKDDILPRTLVRHIKNQDYYTIERTGLMKVNSEWRPSVSYTSAASGKFFTREKEFFLQNFEFIRNLPDDELLLSTKCMQVVEMAERIGVWVNIDQEMQKPYAMGNYRNVIKFYPMRKVYSK